MPVVLTVHDLIPLTADDGMHESLREAFRRRLRNGMRVANRVIAVSQNTRRDLLREFAGYQMPIDVVHWAVADDGMRAARVRGTASPPYVIAFGGEAPRKNTSYMLERFAAVARALPTLRLLVVGVTGDREQHAIQAWAARVGLGARVDLPGFVTDAQLADHLAGARALLYFSAYEGFGMPILEAIACGTPVVASDTSSIPEILSGVRGCFDLAETTRVECAIRKIASNADARAKWASEQHSVLARFSWKEAAQRTASILSDAAHSAR